MADPLDINNESALQGFLKWLHRPESAVIDILNGNPGGAFRQAHDFFLDPIDAVIPGKVFAEQSKPEDYAEVSDLVGGMEPGWKKTAVDVIGGTLLDPLTYTGVGLAAKIGTAPLRAGVSGAANLASKTAAGAKAVEGIKDLGTQAGHQLRAATGNLTPSAPVANAVRAGTDLASPTAKAAQGYAVDAFSKYDPQTQQRAIEILRGVSSEHPSLPGAYADLDAIGKVPRLADQFIDKPTQMARIDQRLALMPWSPDEKALVRDAAEKASDFTRAQWDQGITDNVFHNAGNAPIGHAPADYLPGAYERVAADAEGIGSPSMLQAKSLTDSAKLSDWLNANKAKLDSDLPTLLGDYGQRMGSAVKQAEIGKNLLPGFRNLAQDRGLFKPVIENMRKSGALDDAASLETAISGLPPRGKVEPWMADFNAKLFKPFATGGAFIPRPAFTTRNVVSGVAMTASNPEARGAALGMAADVPKNIMGAWTDGARALGIPVATPEHVQQVEDAIRVSGGKRDAMLNAIADPTLKDAVRYGVIDGGFVSSEKMGADAIQAAQGIKNPRNWRDWPQAITKGSEERMRLGLFTRLTDSGMPAEHAAKVVKDSLYDYAYSSGLNRTIRDVIPFFQFPAKAVPQQVKFLTESGALPSVARNTIEQLYNQGNGAILPPQLQDQPVIPLGRDEKNNPEYLTSFGLPWESLGQVPKLTGELADIGPEIRHNIVAASNPALKALYSTVSGSDPYFDTPFGSYDKAPYVAQALGANASSGAARAWNILSGSGMIQPLASPVNTISGLLDPRRTTGEAALNTLTGIRIKSVDEDQAMQQLLSEALKKNPDVSRYESLYQKSPDEKTQALLAELKAVKGRIHDKKLADAAQEQGNGLEGVEPAKPPPLDPKAMAADITASVRQEIAAATAAHKAEMQAALAEAVAQFKAHPERQAVQVAVPSAEAPKPQVDQTGEVKPGKRKRRAKVKFTVQRDAEGAITSIEASE